MNKFRKLRADEIECRVSQINEKGLTLLLYKDARCDMRILDETVGPMHWQREHVLIDGQLFCRVGIQEEHETYSTPFIWKEDVGTESNTEKEKGRASDAFKRACFNWGIGRELYTAPFIWVPAGNYNAYQKNGKYQTYDRFEVTSIGYDGDTISELTIANQKTHKTVFTLKGHNSTPAAEKPRETANTGHITQKDWTVLQNICAEKGVDPEEVLHRYGFDPKKPSSVTMGAYMDMIKALEEGKL